MNLAPFYRDLTDEELLARHVRGDETAFEEVYRRYSPRLTIFVRRLTRDFDLSEDITQETWLRVHKNAGRHTSTESLFFSWICTISKRIVYNYWRDRGKKLPPVDIDYVQLADLSPSPLRETLDHELGAQIDAAISQLSPDHEQVIRLRHLDDLSYQEVAERCGINLGTLKSRLSRGRTMLEEALIPVLA